MRSGQLSCWSRYAGSSPGLNVKLGGRQVFIQLGPKWPLHLPEPGHQPLNDFILKTKLPRAWGTEPVHKNIFLVCDHCAMCFEYSSIRQVAKIRSVVSLVSSRSYALLFSNEV